MRAVIQRARLASVLVKEEVVGQIDNGLVVLLGVTHEDTIEDAKYLANKIAHSRIFEDDHGKMNVSLKDIGGEILSVSQFTLYGDTRKGRRPNFMEAAAPDHALGMYEQFNNLLRNMDIHVETGEFGEMMDVQFTNVGPVTLIIDSKNEV